MSDVEVQKLKLKALTLTRALPCLTSGPDKLVGHDSRGCDPVFPQGIIFEQKTTTMIVC